ELEEAVGDLPGIRRGCVAVFGSADAASGTERVVVLAETRGHIDASSQEELKKKINHLAMGLLGATADDIVLAPPHTVPKTSSGKIRRVAARDYYERGPSAAQGQAVWLQFALLEWRNYAFVAKGELASSFVTKAFIAGLGALFVERFDVQKSAEHADELVAAAKRGVSLIVFPEGTLLRHTGLMPFRAGA